MTGDIPQSRSDRLPWVFFILAVGTRVPFTSRYLYHLDSCQFALALGKFDVTVHQPHPPGYFLYIMLGRLLGRLLSDANVVFVSISVFFSGLVVAAVYLLGREIFGRKIGVVAALLAVVSPSLWFHGEVALTYIVEAFFSTAAAIHCWKILQGDEKHLWASAVVLGLAGGIRQSTPLFLFPLWAYAMRNLPWKKIVPALGIFAAISLLWFTPMIRMTGGWHAYQEAFRELWKFHVGEMTVFEGGWSVFWIYFRVLTLYAIYGIGLGVFPLAILVYSLARGKRVAWMGKGPILFFSIWSLPVLCFYLFVFISIPNPGYSLIFLPCFLILTAASIEFIGDVFHASLRKILLSVLLVSNAMAFLFVMNPVSFPLIRKHDRQLGSLLHEIQKHNPGKTAVLVHNYLFYSYRHVMYYLPEYRVYNVEIRVRKSGEVRKIFQGVLGETLLTSGFLVPEEVDTFVAPLDRGDPKFHEEPAFLREGITVRDLSPDLRIVTGPVSLAGTVFPEMRFRHHSEKETDHSGK